MKKQSIILVLVALIIVISIVLSSTNIVFTQSLNTNTVVNEIKKTASGSWQNTIFTKEVPDTISDITVKSEIFTPSKYVVSWMPGEWSQRITARLDFYYRPLWDEGFYGLFSQESVSIGRYYVTVDYVDEKGTVKRIIDTHDGITGTTGEYWAWDRNYVEMDLSRWKPMGDRYQSGGHFLPGANMYSTVTFVKNSPITQWYDVQKTGRTDLRTWHILQTDTLEFFIKGLRTGALKIDYYVEWCQRNGGWNYAGWTHLAHDEVVLASGGGDITILGVGSVGEAPPEQEQDQLKSGQVVLGDYYVPYVFEEKSTVKISVDTGYSGSSLSPGDTDYGKPWEIAIYDGQGVQRQSYRLNDNLRGHIISYTIPTGAFVPKGNNEWRVVLKNTMFDQARTSIFVVDDYKKVPGAVTFTLDKQLYTEGDSVTVLMQASPNPDGANDVDYFFIVAKYGSASSMEIVYYKHIPAFKSGDIYKAYTTFNLPTRPQTMPNLYVRVHAVDSDGRAGAGVEKNVKVEQQVAEVTPPTPNPYTDDGFNALMIYGLIAILILLLVVGGLIIHKKRGGDFSQITNIFRRKK
jgi:hypothetical protein